MGVKRVVVHIDRLVLGGFAGEDRDAVLSGLRVELARLMAAPGAADAAASIGSVAALRAPTIRAHPESTPLEIGTAAARAIGGALKP